jgi:hypothetical protein
MQSAASRQGNTSWQFAVGSRQPTTPKNQTTVDLLQEQPLKNSGQSAVRSRQEQILKPSGLDIGTPSNCLPKKHRPQRRRWREKRKTCPYCLIDLTDYDPKEFEELGYVCPLCRHPILDHLLTTPVYQFTRPQQWDLLANEMEYVWKAEHFSYHFAMESTYNPDYGEAKERLFGMLEEKEALLRLREEFILAEGELDLLMIGHLNKLGVWRGDMARRLFLSHPWRMTARRLSITFPSERELAEFQLGLIKATLWAVFKNPAEKDELVEELEKRLERLSFGQSEWGA